MASEQPGNDARIAALEAAFVELIGGFYSLLGEQGPALLDRALRHCAEDVLPPAGVDRVEFQIAVAALLARMDERQHPS